MSKSLKHQVARSVQPCASPVAVVAELVVGGVGEVSTEPRAHRVEDLYGRVNPNLHGRGIDTFVYKN